MDLGARSYEIHIGTALLEQLGGLCKERGLSGHCLVVSDANVDPLYGHRTEISLKAAGFSVGRAVVAAGEGSKSERSLSELYDRALDTGLDRQSFIVALGGGVVGDLAGYAAATFLRGIRYVQVPTSLLAMVDSSVGGKTGINLRQGKNLVGAFHQPALVVTDTDTLKTLPPREYISGLAEVVKHGAIRDAAFFSDLESHIEDLTACGPAFMDAVIGRCCELKAEIVRLDERESGLRAILNFGHTFGHAIERVAGYGRYFHGDAVSMGMAVAGWVSVGQKGLPERDSARLNDLLHRLGLPIEMPDCAWADVRKAMRFDKKAAGQVPRFVLLEKLGHAVPGCEVPEDALKEAWKKYS
ncbi:MAG: 3-dehydroquinate synthase [Verrucomicrobiota bacterium]